MRLQQTTRDFTKRLQTEALTRDFNRSLQVDIYVFPNQLINCKVTYLRYKEASVRVFIVNTVYAAFVHLSTR